MPNEAGWGAGLLTGLLRYTRNDKDDKVSSFCHCEQALAQRGNPVALIQYPDLIKYQRQAHTFMTWISGSSPEMTQVCNI